jgi:protein-tyrosine phosphatase
MKTFVIVSTFAIVAVLGACSPAETATDLASPARIDRVEVSLDRESSAYKITWAMSEPGSAVDLSVSSNPDGSNATQIAEDVKETSFSWTPGAGDKGRRYFVVTPDAGEPIITATRLLPLEGGRNFRDLGGYKTEDGRTVKWGQVFRSGTMHELTDNDYEYLSGVGIKVVCDFRAAQERATEPTAWRGSAVDYVYFPDPASDPADNYFTRVLFEPNVTPEMVADAMAKGYPAMAKEQAPAYSEMFDRLAAGEIPLAFNCSAGKDRAGTGAALLLTALGVPRETVVADYALSETYVDYMAEFTGSAEDPISADSPYAYLAKMPPELLAPLMRSDPRYIETTFQTLEAEYGSVMNFIETELGVTEAELQSIRSTLLE